VGELESLFLGFFWFWIFWGVFMDKRCSKCLEWKPRRDFYKNNRRRDGYQDRCKSCEQEYNRSKKGKERKSKYANKITSKLSTFDF